MSESIRKLVLSDIKFDGEESSMKKKIVLIICVLLVLAAGAGIGYKFTRMTVKMNLDSDTVVYQNRAYRLSETARAVFSRDSANVSSLCDNVSLEPVDFRTRQFGRYGESLLDDLTATEQFYRVQNDPNRWFLINPGFPRDLLYIRTDFQKPSWREAPVSAVDLKLDLFGQPGEEAEQYSAGGQAAVDALLRRLLSGGDCTDLLQSIQGLDPAKRYEIWVTYRDYPLHELVGYLQDGQFAEWNAAPEAGADSGNA